MADMRVRVKAHFDGQTFVPDGPVDLPVHQAVVVEAEVVGSASADTGRATSVEVRNRALLDFLRQPRSGPGLPDWAMDREHIYDDAGAD
jgi:hypothetical protein